jgi:hypothetical protein
MSSTSRRSAVNSAACFLAAFFAVSAVMWDHDALPDGLTDDLATPSCRIGSLDAWKGQPCAVPLQTGLTEGTATPR